MLWHLLDVQELPAAMQVFLPRYVQAGVALADAQHDGFGGDLSVTGLDGMRIQQFSSFAEEIHSMLLQHTGDKLGKRCQVLLFIGHQLLPVDGSNLIHADILIPLETFHKFKRPVQQDLGVAAIVGASAARQIVIHQDDLFPRRRQG